MEGVGVGSEHSQQIPRDTGNGTTLSSISLLFLPRGLSHTILSLEKVLAQLLRVTSNGMECMLGARTSLIEAPAWIGVVGIGKEHWHIPLKIVISSASS